MDDEMAFCEGTSREFCGDWLAWFIDPWLPSPHMAAEAPGVCCGPV